MCHHLLDDCSWITFKVQKVWHFSRKISRLDETTWKNAKLEPPKWIAWIHLFAVKWIWNWEQSHFSFSLSSKIIFKLTKRAFLFNYIFKYFVIHVDCSIHTRVQTLIVMLTALWLWLWLKFHFLFTILPQIVTISAMWIYQTRYFSCNSIFATITDSIKSTLRI